MGVKLNEHAIAAIREEQRGRGPLVKALRQATEMGRVLEERSPFEIEEQVAPFLKGYYFSLDDDDIVVKNTKD